MCFKKISIRSFKGVSSFVLEFYSPMYLTAATRAEGGLVCCIKSSVNSSMYQKSNQSLDNISKGWSTNQKLNQQNKKDQKLDQ